MKIQGKSVSSRTVNEEAMRQFSLMEPRKRPVWLGPSEYGIQKKETKLESRQDNEHLPSQVKVLDCLLGYQEATRGSCARES